MRYFYYSLMVIPVVGGTTFLINFINAARAGRLELRNAGLLLMSCAIGWVLWRLAKGHPMAHGYEILSGRRTKR